MAFQSCSMGDSKWLPEEHCSLPKVENFSIDCNAENIKKFFFVCFAIEYTVFNDL